MSTSAKPSGAVRFGVLPAISRMQQVRDQLEAAIERGDYRPGDRLPSERELVELLGVSRVIVREAIRSLEALGMVDVQQGRGCFVAASRSDQYATTFSHWLTVHRHDLMELLLVRGALDELAAESAARNADALAVARLRELNDQFRATDPQDLEQLLEADVAFHNAVAEASGTDLLADLLRDLHKTFNEARRATLLQPGRPDQSGREHEAIIEAIEQQDPAAAKAAVAAHLATVRASLAQLSA